MHASEVTEEVVERANALYWGSDRSVNQIADDLELSKGALYGIVEPEPSGLGCPLCGDEVVYSNRTAKEKKMLDCLTCDWDGAPDEAASFDDSSYRDASEATDIDLPTGRDDTAGRDGDTAGRDDGEHALSDTPSAPERVPSRPYIRPSTSTVVGGALLGAAVGLALVLWARRR